MLGRIEVEQITTFPEHLTASSWKGCDRAMWFKFRHAATVIIPADRARTFALGHAVEELVIKLIRDAGYKISHQQAELLADNGKPIGHIDGIVSDGSVFSLLEVKSANNKSFNAIKKGGLPDYYYAQIQIYMHKSGQLSQSGRKLEKTEYFVLNKDTSELLNFSVPYEESYAALQCERMGNIVDSERVPEPTRDYRCSICDYRSVCDGLIAPRVSCRTCANVNIKAGSFSCVFGLSVCDNFIMHPELMALSGNYVLDANQETRAIEYEYFIQAPKGTEIVRGKKPIITADQYALLLLHERNKDAESIDRVSRGMDLT